MGIFKSLATRNKYETGANYELGRSVSSSSFSNIFGTGGDNIDVLKEYSGFVWKAINIRSEEVSAVDYYVQREVAGQWQNDLTHEFNTVMAGEEGGMDEAEFMEAHQVYMDMYGEAFWYFSKGASSSKPYSRYLLDPNCMTVLVSGDKATGYIYQKEGDRIVLDLEEVSHYKIFNPQNPFRGAGPMQKAGWFVRSSRYATTFVNNFLENNAIPAGVIVAEDTVDDKDWELFKQSWKNNYGGIDNQGKTAFVRGNKLDFVKTGISLGDVDFEKVTNSSKNDILQMFSIPKSKLGDFGDFNKASAVQSDETWAKTFTEKAVSRILRKMSRKVAVWYGKQYRYGSDFVVPEDRVQKLEEYKIGVGKFITVNEAREAYGLPKLGKEYDLITSESAIPAQTAKSLGKIVIKTVQKNTKQGFDYQMKESFRSQTEAMQIKYEKKFYAAANPVLEDQKKAVLDQLQPKKAYNTQFDIDTEAKLLEEALLPLLIELANEQGALAIQLVASTDLDFELTPVARNMIRQSVLKATQSFTMDIQEAIAKAVADGIAAGDSIASIASEIDGIYKNVLGIKKPGWKLERLARTEVIKNSNAITELAYKQSGVVSKKEWFANPGHCEFCDALNGSIINLGTSFVSQGDTVGGSEGGTYKADYENVQTPALHPNCRCTLIPVIGG